MKLFLAGTSFNPRYGGPAYSVSRLGLALANAGVDVGLWAPDGSAVRSDLATPTHPFLRRFDGRANEALAAFGRPDVLHDNGIWLTHNHRLARLAAAQSIPRVVSLRGMLEPWALRHKRAKKWLAWLAYQRRDLRTAQIFHATAQAEADHVQKLGLARPICLLANGMDLPEVMNRPLQSVEAGTNTKRQRVALFLGRLHPKKGLPMLLDAWARLRPQDWILHIAGPDEGGHAAQLQDQVRSAGLSDTVKFLGAVGSGEKSEIYTSADIFVLPTHSENFGMVVAEALAHGVPVLTTTGAPWRRLQEGDCGWWVAPNVDAITDGLRLATSCAPKLLQEMGQRGRTLIANDFAWDPIARQFIRVYEGLASRGIDRAPI